ncbi:MAG: hypothetical protein U5L72_01525 [Bacteroidales bacterium]|nr:hypothetical protein [Bacteroidales bacterium]
MATTPEYVVGVWAGNADGEGRPGLTGVSSAGPVVFDLLSWLSPEGWFERPEGDELTLISVCRESGYRAGVDCTDTVEEWVPVSGLKTEACPYHRIVHLNSARTNRVNSSCAAPGQIVSESWFVLPPAMEHFYRQKNPSYRVLPAMAPGCEGDANIPEMEFIYPPREAGIFIPRDHTGERTRFVAELLHRDPAARVFWHLDNTYLGEKQSIYTSLRYQLRMVNIQLPLSIITGIQLSEGSISNGKRTGGRRGGLGGSGALTRGKVFE